MLTPAEADMLRALPRQLGAQAAGRADPTVQRRARLQAAGLLTVRWDAAAGCFLVMITDAGVRALDGAP